MKTLDQLASAEGGIAALARRLGYQRPYISRVVNLVDRPSSGLLAAALREFGGEFDVAGELRRHDGSSADAA